MTGLRTLSAADRVAALAERGIMLYVDGVSLRARCEPDVAPLLEAARPMLAKHRAEIVEWLRRATNSQGPILE